MWESLVHGTSQHVQRVWFSSPVVAVAVAVVQRVEPVILYGCELFALSY